MGESSPKGWKTLWEKGKLLVASNFSFSRCVFKRVLLQTRKNKGLFGKGLTDIHNKIIDYSNFKSMGECNIILSAYTFIDTKNSIALTH